LKPDLVLEAHSLVGEYASKLLANGLSVPVALVSQTIISACAGPEMFGNFTFLANFFSESVAFSRFRHIDWLPGKLSQRPRTITDGAVLLGFVGLVALLVGALVWLSFGLGVHQLLWPGHRGRWWRSRRAPHLRAGRPRWPAR